MSILKIRDSDGNWQSVTAIKGDKGDAFTYDDFTDEQLAALKGQDGQDGADGLPVSITINNDTHTQVDGNIDLGRTVGIDVSGKTMNEGTGYEYVGGLNAEVFNGADDVGIYNVASGDYSHAEGHITLVSGNCSHAEGNGTEASGEASHAEGYGTTASGDCSHVQGKYNIADADGVYADIVGNGTADARANIQTLDWDGNAWTAGKYSQGGTPTEDNDLTTKVYTDAKLLEARTYINTAIAELIGESPDALDTLYELATALDNDPNFATTVTNLIADKVSKVDGKSLSSNDFTDDLLTKLNGIATGANKTLITNNLTGTTSTKALSEAQGKVLNETKMGLPVESADEETAISASEATADTIYWWEE